MDKGLKQINKVFKSRAHDPVFWSMTACLVIMPVVYLSFSM